MGTTIKKRERIMNKKLTIASALLVGSAAFAFETWIGTDLTEQIATGIANDTETAGYWFDYGDGGDGGDEPTSALDVSTQKEVIKMIFDLLDKGIFSTMIFITHELPLLYHVADNIAIMYAGEIVEKGTAEQVVKDPRHPYTQALMGAMLSTEASQRGRHPVAIEGAPPSLKNKIVGCRFAPRCSKACPDCKKNTQNLRIVGDRDVRCDYAK